MSFIDSVLNFGKGVVNFFTGDSIGSQLAKTALLGYSLNKITKSINRDNDKAQEKTVDPGSRITTDASTDNKIPVVYGTAFVGGILVDAHLTNSNQTMVYVLALSEKTGVKISDNQQSQFSFKAIYYNDERLVFQGDGVTVANSVDRAGTTNTSYNGLIKVYCYNGNSTTRVGVEGYSSSGSYPAYSVVPNWDTNNNMSDLIFAVVRIDYNKDKSLTSLGTLQFQIENSMTLPGDCMYDLMTNTRYGAAIDPSEILTS